MQRKPAVGSRPVENTHSPPRAQAPGSHRNAGKTCSGFEACVPLSYPLCIFLPYHTGVFVKQIRKCFVILMDLDTEG